ncbi:hypothetical protein CKAN_02414000 [Cinnamomum micranthum f. kanehirae]|uniref:Uncharacterized protein n=1 Tax=Cinnamomum micranthum f. kanehirae TaxID=337451 RepID=A0A3S3N963_9MAGN|nr:hypothetical protein CKAN_02414000 [Cinnamomum micranthum f. kanehirae]
MAIPFLPNFFLRQKYPCLTLTLKNTCLDHFPHSSETKSLPPLCFQSSEAVAVFNPAKPSPVLRPVGAQVPATPSLVADFVG